MRVLSLVVDGYERAASQGLIPWVFEQNADIICLQNTHCSEYSIKTDAAFPEGYHAYFADNYDNPSINGCAIYCKDIPKAIMMGLGFIDFDHLGIYLQADYDTCSIGSLLVPSGVAPDGDRSVKLSFLHQLDAHLQKVRNKKRDFILCGGWEMAWRPVDAEESGNRIDIPGFSTEERDWLGSLYRNGYADAFREAEPDSEEFTWWPEGDDSPGIRTDTQIISESLCASVESASVYTNDVFSSHAPVIVDYDITL